MNRIKIFNAKVITPFRLINNGSILVENGKITCVSEEDIIAEGFHQIDAKGQYLAPGFIDIHTHGGGGYDFMDGTAEAYIGAAELHAKYGTTALVPTTLTSTNEELRNTFRVFKQAKAMNKNGAELLGLHLEGPYFSIAQKGAQDERFIKNPNLKEYSEITSWSDDIIRWSAAPELPGALEFGRFMKLKGILASIAHSDAVYEDVIKGVENGFSHVTHLYSGMSGVKRINAHRYSGVIESALLIDELTVEVIADGVHLPASLLQLVYKIKGADKIALVTDSMRAAGMPEGESMLGSLKEGQKVIVENGVAKLPDRSAFAGSVATADCIVRTMVEMAKVSVIDAVKMMSHTPAKIIGLDAQKGSLSIGKDADMVILDNSFTVRLTIVNGKIVYQDEMFG